MRIYLFFLFLILVLNISCSKRNGHLPSKSEVNETRQSEYKSEYRIGLYKNSVEEFDPKKITHIIVVGSALKEDSDQFFQSGISRAQRYKDLWPDHQVALIGGPDVLGASDEQIFNFYKVSVVKFKSTKLTTPVLLNEVGIFEKIASLDFFGHASPWAMILGKSGATFDPSVHIEELKLLRPKFTADAYVTLNGCNTGFYLAPDLSRGLALPVSGSLTSSMFETIESNGLWYKEEDSNPKGYVRSNRFSFMSEQPCRLGLCTRMKPSRGNYSSYWGTFNEGGLSFDKFFCNYENNNDMRCERGMAMSLLGFPSVYPITLNSKDNEYKAVVFDWLCSNAKNKNYFIKCVTGIKDAIARGDLEYQSHPSNELNCNFNSCHATVACKYKPFGGGPVPGSCTIDTIPNDFPKNITKEYLSLMKGFEYLRLK